MQKLARGVRKFQQDVFSGQRDFFMHLEEGQQPHTLFITCSDSRINPALITQTQPGELFIIRNVGNLVPTYGRGDGGEAAAIEFAVAGLEVAEVVICGHSSCGAMKAVLEPSLVQGLPAMRDWVQQAEVTRRIVEENYSERQGEDRLNVAIQENVLAQVDSLRTHPAVAARLSRGDLRLHAWVYEIGKGLVFAYDASALQFLPLQPGSRGLEASRRRLVSPDAVGP
jgi:carbonic anhydrase